MWTKLDNLDNLNIIGQSGQNWIIRTKLDNTDKIGQNGTNWDKI